MDKDLEFNIKIVKHFDVNTEKETVKYYIKKKSVFGWWYLKDDRQDFFPAFMGSAMLDTLIVSLIAYFSKYTFNIDLHTYHYFFISMLSLRGFWFLISFKIFKRDFESQEEALNHIKNLIRKSNLEEYHTTEDIKITYKEGNLEVEK